MPSASTACSAWYSTPWRRPPTERAGLVGRCASITHTSLVSTPRSGARSWPLLLKLREELGVGIVVVTHDLGLAWNIADRIAVMHLGRVVEFGTTEEVLEAPRHPYAQALLSVVPEMERLEPVVLRGEIPDPTHIPGGCRFHPRCPALADGSAERAGVAARCVSEPLAVLPSLGSTGWPVTSTRHCTRSTEDDLSLGADHRVGPVPELPDAVLRLLDLGIVGHGADDLHRAAALGEGGRVHPPDRPGLSVVVGALLVDQEEVGVRQDGVCVPPELRQGGHDGAYKMPGSVPVGGSCLAVDDHGGGDHVSSSQPGASCATASVREGVECPFAGYSWGMTDTGPGFIALVGAPTPESDEGKARLELEVDDRHLNPAGAVHGGMLATLVDATMGAAVRSAVDEEAPATSQLTITYLRPGKPGRLSVTARVSKRGESLTVCEADVEQDGKTLVHALATFALVGD